MFTFALDLLMVHAFLPPTLDNVIWGMGYVLFFGLSLLFYIALGFFLWRLPTYISVTLYLFLVYRRSGQTMSMGSFFKGLADNLWMVYFEWDYMKENLNRRPYGWHGIFNWKVPPEEWFQTMTAYGWSSRKSYEDESREDGSAGA